MKITPFQHQNVNPDGTFSNGKRGAIKVKSQADKLSAMDIVINEARKKDGTVSGVHIEFQTQKERKQFIEEVMKFI